MVCEVLYHLVHLFLFLLILQLTLYILCAHNFHLHMSKLEVVFPNIYL